MGRSVRRKAPTTSCSRKTRFRDISSHRPSQPVTFIVEVVLMSATEKTPPIRLLVVDDDETLLEMMKQRFERIGMNVLATTKGLESLNIAEAERIDIALLDINLPDSNGLELL